MGKIAFGVDIANGLRYAHSGAEKGDVYIDIGEPIKVNGYEGGLDQLGKDIVKAVNSQVRVTAPSLVSHVLLGGEVSKDVLASRVDRLRESVADAPMAVDVASNTAREVAERGIYLLHAGRSFGRRGVKVEGELVRPSYQRLLEYHSQNLRVHLDRAS